MAIFAPLVVKIFGAPGPDVRDTSALDIFGTPTGPSSDHIFGVDQLGRDVFSRTVYGARVSLIVAFTATGIATIIGIITGLLAGYYRGWTDTIVSRSVDVLLAIPYLLLATGLAAACTLGGAGCLGGLIKPGLGVVIFVIAFTSWTYMTRIIRGQVLSLREKEFVEAARSIGASDTRIIFRELLPNLVAPIIVYASILIPQVILYEAALSFLGVGVQPPTAELGPDDLRRHARSSATPGGTCCSRAWRCCSRCWPSTSSATRCRTPSTRARRRLDLDSMNYARERQLPNRKERSMRSKLLWVLAARADRLLAFALSACGRQQQRAAPTRARRSEVRAADRATRRRPEGRRR